MILGLLETVGFNVIIGFEIWIEIQGREVIGMAILKVYSEDIESISNNKQKAIVWKRNDFLVVGSIINEFLIEIFHIEEHCFGLVGYRCNDEGKGFSDVGDNGI